MRRQSGWVDQEVAPVAVPAGFGGDLSGWLSDQAQRLSLRWLLAHADDGVIWGEFADGALRLSGDVFPQVSPALRAITLQQARLFGANAELLVWRDGEHWRARSVVEGAGEAVDVFDEPHLLWGTHLAEAQGGFSLLKEGKEGLRHAPPLNVGADAGGSLAGRRVALLVRHTLGYDDDGQARVIRSRLVGLKLVGDRDGGQA